MARRGSFEVTLEGRGVVTLREADYVASGGEGAIYRTGQTGVKLYTDTAKMARDGVAEKIKLLAGLKHSGIVAPQGPVLDAGKKPIGFYMPFIAGGEPMSRVFVSDFRARTGFGDADAIALSQSMFEIVQYAHSKKALLVDANELNWLAMINRGSAPTAAVIDVDSWAIGRWPATVIMPSIRDWSAQHFTEATDWFAWGIVAFQIFTGIHPFKGRIEGYKPGDLVQRMKDGASVFDKRAKLPLSVRDFACIPGPLLDWFQTTFQVGKRNTPPAPTAKGKPAKTAQIMRAVTTATAGALIFERLFARAGDPVVRIWANGAALLASGDLVDLATGREIGVPMPGDVEVVRVGNGWLVASDDGVEIRVEHFAGDGNIFRINVPLALRRIFRAGETLFGVTHQSIVELDLHDLGRPMLTPGRHWVVMERAITWLDDVAVQDVLGNAFVILPHTAGMSIVRTPELDGFAVVSGKACGRFAAFTVLDRRDGTHQRIEITFDKAMRTYQAWTGPADGPDLNMAILPRGVAATITTDFELTVFVPTNGNVNKVRDTGVNTAMKLARWGDRIVYIADSAVWQLRMAP